MFRSTQSRRLPAWKIALSTAVALPVAFSLVACGGSTVDSAKLSSAQQSSAQASSSSSSSVASESAASRRTDHSSSAEPEINDPAAKQTDSAPNGQMPLSGKDEAYLDALVAAKIDVDGVEDALIGAARAHCAAGLVGDEANVMVDAIAGQLVAQDRVKADPKDVSSSIAKAAKDAYC